MSQFVTGENRKKIWESKNKIREQLFTDSVNDDVTLATLEEVKIKIDFAVEYMRAARYYKKFNDGNNKFVTDDNS